MAVPYLACMLIVANFYHLPPQVLPAIQAVEGGSVGSISPNTDGSADLGVMQVNTLWIQPIARASHQQPGEIARRLVFDPCYNITVAGQILRSYLDETHGNLMLAVGDYHSHTPFRNLQYQLQVAGAARRMFLHSAAAAPKTRGPSMTKARRAALAAGNSN